MSSKVLIKMYNDLDIRCSFENCKKVVKLLDLAKHETVCQRAKCWNFDNCEGNDEPVRSEGFPCCSPTCALLKAVVGCGNDQKKLYEEIKKFLESRNVDMKKDSTATSIISCNPKSVIVPANQSGSINFRWDATKCGQGIELFEGGQVVFLREQSYVFRTVVAEACLMSGVHYW